MSRTRRIRSAGLIRGVLAVLICLALWEMFARTSRSTSLTPPLELIGQTLAGMLVDGTLLINTLHTLGRVLLGFCIAALIAVPLGILMGRSRFAERFFLPVVSVLLPIPSLAWVPLFTLWFGIGNTATICVVVYAAFFPLIYNVWAGVRSVLPIWTRAATVMGAGRWALWRKVVWPASLPYVIAGTRLSVGRAWIGVIGGEMLASPTFGLGQIIFNAKEFLNASVMLSVLVVIGLIGVITERFIFNALEEATIRKWGMAASARR
ncbi:MAG: ABC transporter permease [Hyphomonadaceae bacterium]|jgi:ABC-type nitrate/sulfonate/bicarbonate transport system permease component|nr:ABC transporter permease [Hyphomonadaceae bacterium]